MLKKITLFAAAILLIASLTGCSCTGTTATPTPTASLAPSADMTPMAQTTPDAVMSPDAATSPDPGATPGSGDVGMGMSTSGMEPGNIENFQEGTEVRAEDVPDVKKAVEDKYAGATIQTVKHAMNNSQQVYEVTISTGGSTKALYVTPDGTVTEKTA